jgi:hypothetical protein
MINPPHNYFDAEQLQARQVGQPQPAPSQPPAALLSSTAHTGAEIDRQVEQIRWLMRREPMLERELRTAESLLR